MFALGILSLCQGKKFSSLQNAATHAKPVAKKNPLRFAQEDITGRCDRKLDCVDLVRSWGCDEVWAEKCPHRDHPQGAEYNRNAILESCAETCDMQMRGDKSLQPKSREERQKEKEVTLCLVKRAEASAGDKEAANDLVELAVAETQILLPEVAGDDPEEIAATQKAGTNAALNIADKDFSGKTDHIFTETMAEDDAINNYVESLDTLAHSCGTMRMPMRLLRWRLWS